MAVADTPGWRSPQCESTRPATVEQVVTNRQAAGSHREITSARSWGRLLSAEIVVQ